MQKYNKKHLPLLVFSTVLGLLLLFTAASRFNLVGYSYQFSETTMTMHFEEGHFSKTNIDIPFAEGHNITIVFLTSAIDEANNLWVILIFFIAFFIAAFIGLLLPPLRPQKYIKSITCMYVLSLVTLIIWSYHVHMALYKEIVKNMSRLVN